MQGMRCGRRAGNLIRKGEKREEGDRGNDV